MLNNSVSTEPWSEDRARELVRRHTSERGPLLGVLHELHDTFGYLDRRAISVVADVLNLSEAEVYGVITFYKDFRSEPAGASVMRICRAEACQSMGAEALAAHASRRLGVALGETTTDGQVTLEQVFCLGNCALSPAVMIDGEVFGRVDHARFDELLSGLARRADRLPDDDSTPGHDRPRIRTAPVTTIYVSRDTAARSVGADSVAAELVVEAASSGLELVLVRPGSRGLLWLEPLVEVATPEGRIAFGGVAPGDVAGLLEAVRAGEPATSPLYLGPTEEIPYLARQQRITFGRVGIVDPLSPVDFEANGGLLGLRRALELESFDIVNEVVSAGLRGRGGAGFPTGIKWRTVLDTSSDLKFICCNADEGDSGTFADRMLMEGDPFLLVEGMVIAGLAVEATEGYLYIRSEYPAAVSTMRAAIELAYGQGWLGAHVCGGDRQFDLEVRVGAGAYICGEETSMLESLEGNRGVARAKPPLPAIEGLFGKPTVVNNVLTLAAVPAILADGAEAYGRLGLERSRGTQIFQLAGNIRHGGIVELPFGVSLRELVEDFGGGTATGRPLRAVQVGGPLGSYLPEHALDLPMDYEAFAAAGAMVGHGGVVAFDDTVDMARQARFAMEFCAEESCGKCTPCRVGSVRGIEVIDKIIADEAREENLELLEDLCELMVDGSLCAMGGLTPQPVRSALRHFPEDFVGADDEILEARGAES